MSRITGAGSMSKEVTNPICLRKGGRVSACTYSRARKNIIKSRRLLAWLDTVAAEVARECSKTDHVTLNPGRVGKPTKRGGRFRMGSRSEVVAAIEGNNRCSSRALKRAHEVFVTGGRTIEAYAQPPMIEIYRGGQR